MSSPSPTGLLASEISALRASAGISVEDFAKAFGVSAKVVERWEALGVPTSPTALSIRLVAETMDFEFPPPVELGHPCAICEGPAVEWIRGNPICEPCHRHPVPSLGALGYEAAETHNAATNHRGYELRLPAGKTMRFSGRFVSEGLGTMLVKLFKEEPQIGIKGWDDAVYVQWVEPGLSALDDPTVRALIKALVVFGMVDVDQETISVQNTTMVHDRFADEIFFLCGLLASQAS